MKLMIMAVHYVMPWAASLHNSLTSCYTNLGYRIADQLLHQPGLSHCASYKELTELLLPNVSHSHLLYMLPQKHVTYENVVQFCTWHSKMITLQLTLTDVLVPNVAASRHSILQHRLYQSHAHMKHAHMKHKYSG